MGWVLLTHVVTAIAAGVISYYAGRSRAERRHLEALQAIHRSGLRLTEGAE